MPDEQPRRFVRCVIEGHIFDFNADLGAVAIGRSAACTPCMDKVFRATDDLSEGPPTDKRYKKPRRIA